MSSTHIPKELRSRLEEIACGCCEYCQTLVAATSAPPTIDHIQPPSLGGPTVFENLAFSCFGCNLTKGVRVEALDPATSRSTPLFHPRRQRWRDHFVWSADMTLVLGITPTGRATARALELNRAGLPLWRAVFHIAGLHPPPEW